MHKRWLAVVALVALLLVPASAARPAALGAPSASPAWVTTAKQRLSKLDTKAAASLSGYSRAQFGPAWFDVDLNGCSTRNDILAPDLRQVTFKPNDDCVVATGVLHDRYTGTTAGSFHCRYIARQIAIKTKYDLWVTQPERLAMSGVLGGC